MSVEHTESVYPAAHTHENASSRSMQLPPFSHGDDAHSSMSVAQVKPLYPAAQSHEKDPTSSMHVAPLEQGEDRQSSKSSTHKIGRVSSQQAQFVPSSHAESVVFSIATVPRQGLQRFVQSEHEPPLNSPAEVVPV